MLLCNFALSFEFCNHDYDDGMNIRTISFSRRHLHRQRQLGLIDHAIQL